MVGIKASNPSNSRPLKPELPLDDSWKTDTDVGVKSRKVTVISREEWGALPPKEDIETLQSPVERVGVSFNSHTRECFSKEECMEIARFMQIRDMSELDLPDIAYSWIIGGDGNVYEGRGWKTKPNLTLENPRANFEKMIDVCYIGDWEDKIDPKTMFTTYINFIRQSIDERKVIKEFEVK